MNLVLLQHWAESRYRTSRIHLSLVPEPQGRLITSWMVLRSQNLGACWFDFCRIHVLLDLPSMGGEGPVVRPLLVRFDALWCLFFKRPSHILLWLFIMLRIRSRHSSPIPYRRMSVKDKVSFRFVNAVMSCSAFTQLVLTDYTCFSVIVAQMFLRGFCPVNHRQVSLLLLLCYVRRKWSCVFRL